MIDNTKLYINKNVYIEMVGFFRKIRQILPNSLK